MYKSLELCHWSDDDLQIISKRTSFGVEDLRLVLKWNILTVPQMALLCNISESRVRNAISPYALKNGANKKRLSTVAPFPDDKDGGKLFILVDDIARNFILNR